MRKNIFVVLFILIVLVSYTSCYPFITKTVTVYNPTDLPVQINSTEFGCYNVMLGAHQSKTFGASAFTFYASFDVEGAYFIKTSQGVDLSPFIDTRMTLEPNCCFVIIDNQTGEKLENVSCGIFQADYDPQKAVTNPFYSPGRKNDILRSGKKGAKVWPEYEFTLKYGINGKSYWGKTYTTTEAGTALKITIY